MRTETVARLCGNCTHSSFGDEGVFCLFFRDQIYSEKVAQQCEVYDPREYEVAAPALRVLSGGRDQEDIYLDPDLVARCESYLDSLPCSTWGRNFDIVSADTRQQAATWLAEQIRRLVGA